MVASSSANSCTGSRSLVGPSMDTWNAAPQAPALAAKWQAAMTVQAGLINMGNTCYINSVLACLSAVPVLGNLLRSPHGMALHRSGVCRVTAPSKCTACLLSKQLLALMAERQQAIRPVHIVQNLPAISKTFQRGRQEDSHEFFHCLLDAAERDSKGPKKDLQTVVEQLFQGRSISQVRCLACGHESNTYEAFCSLSLDIGKAASVQDSFGLFSNAEFLDGANKYKCDKCQGLVRARKQVAIWDEPNVLTLHLKRFNASAFSNAKVGRHVSFPLILDLEPYAAHKLLGAGSGTAGGPAAGGSRAPYQLVSVLVHQGGSVHSGHYFAYVRDSASRWFCVNDESVYRVSPEHVQQQQAYLLFYARMEVKTLRVPPAPAPTAQQQQQQQQQHNGNSVQARHVFGPQLPLGKVASTGQVFGPQLPDGSGAVATGKRSRSSDDGLPEEGLSGAADQAKQVQAAAPPALGSKQLGSTTVAQASGARTVVLPAKRPALPQKLQQQQQNGRTSICAEIASATGPGASNGQPAATFRVRPAGQPGLGAPEKLPAKHVAVPSSNQHAGQHTDQHAHTNGFGKHARKVHDDNAPAGMQEPSSAKRLCLPSLSTPAAAPASKLPLPAPDSFQLAGLDASKQQIKAHLLAQLRGSKYEVETRRTVAGFWAERGGGNATQEQLDALLDELLDSRAPLRRQVHIRLPVLQPELVKWSMASVSAALARPSAAPEPR